MRTSEGKRTQYSQSGTKVATALPSMGVIMLGSQTQRAHSAGSMPTTPAGAVSRASSRARAGPAARARMAGMARGCGGGGEWGWLWAEGAAAGHSEGAQAKRGRKMVERCVEEKRRDQARRTRAGGRVAPPVCLAAPPGRNSAWGEITQPALAPCGGRQLCHSVPAGEGRHTGAVRSGSMWCRCREALGKSYRRPACPAPPPPPPSASALAAASASAPVQSICCSATDGC